jgi:signal transduction histidine kinase
MNQILQNLQDKLLSLGMEEDDIGPFYDLIKKLNKEITILEFKLDRTEKVKRTTSVLLEETIEELEKKRQDVEKTNAALSQSLEELKSTQAQLIHSEKMASLGELTAGIAHEIQNPLNFVNNFSEVSSEMIEEVNEALTPGSGLPDIDEAREILEDLKSNLEKITHHGKRASGIVKSMLDHSRTNTGEKEETNINILCDEYLRLAYHGMRAKDRSFNVVLETKFDEGIPSIKIIPQDIGRVLLNLINNGLQALNSEMKDTNQLNKSPKLKLITKLIRDEIRISVIDNGPGIRDAIKDKIFQPFFTTKPTGEGTGLGLSLSYDIIRSHGGKILIDSTLGEGTSFTIILPI